MLGPQTYSVIDRHFQVYMQKHTEKFTISSPNKTLYRFI